MAIKWLLCVVVWRYVISQTVLCADIPLTSLMTLYVCRCIDWHCDGQAHGGNWLATDGSAVPQSCRSCCCHYLPCQFYGRTTTLRNRPSGKCREDGTVPWHVHWRRYFHRVTSGIRQTARFVHWARWVNSAVNFGLIVCILLIPLNLSVYQLSVEAAYVVT